MAPPLSASELSRELAALLTRYRDHLSPSELADALDVARDALIAPTSSLEPRVISTVALDSGLHQVTLRLNDLELLRVHTREILELQAICLPIEGQLPIMADISFVLAVLDTAVTLPARIVHVSSKGSVIQFRDMDVALRQKIQVLPDVFTSKSASRHAPPAAAPVLSAPPAATSAHPPASRRVATLDTLRRSTRVDTLTLDARRPFKSLLSLISHDFSGLIEIYLDDFTLEMTLRKGALIHMDRTPQREQDRLESLLHRAGKLSSEQLDRLTSTMQSQGGESDEVMLELGLIDYSALRIALKTRHIYLSRALFARHWKKTLVWRCDTSPIRSIAPALSLAALCFQHLYKSSSTRESFDTERMRGQYEEASLRLTFSPEQLATLELEDSRQLRFFSILSERAYTLSELLLVSPVPSSDALVLLHVIDQMGGLDIQSAPEIKRLGQGQRQRLELMLTNCKSEDHFEVLGLHWSAFDDEIERAYQDLVAQYDPSRFAEFSEEVAQIQARLKLAYDALRKPTKRRFYRAQLIGEFKISTSRDIFFKQAEAAQLKRDVEGALEFYQRVVELDPLHRQALSMIPRLRELIELSKNSSSP